MKYLRLVLLDPTFVVRWSMLLVICGIISYQYKTLDFQSNRVAQLISANQERQRLANLRNTIQPPVKPVPVVTAKIRKSYNLEGSSRQFDTYQALINGRVYKAGDPLDDFVVRTITMDSATLVHRETGETQVLQFQGLQITPN